MKLRRKGTTEWIECSEEQGYSPNAEFTAEAFAEEWGLDNGDVIEIKGRKKKYKVSVEIERTVTLKAI